MYHASSEQIVYMQAHIDENRQPWFIGANVAFLIVALGSVALRFLARIKIGTRLGLDDWLIFTAALCVLGHVICLLVSTTMYNMGRHVLLLEDAKSFTIVTLAAQTCYNLSIPFAKLSILCLYNRIFRRTNGWFMPTLWMTSAFVALSAIPPVFVYILQCTPIHSLWSEVGPGEKVVCLNFKAAIIVFGIINIASDIFILSLPIPVVWGLQLDKRTKLSVCALFLVGSVVCVISVVRLVYAKNVETADPTWDLTTIAILSTLEASAAVMVACMPTWRPLFRFLGRGITSYFNGSSKNGKGDDTQNLKYGNNMPIGGRGRWSGMPPRMSITDKEHTASGAKGSRLSYILGQKRSETSMSGESVEKMLHGQEIELELSNSDSKTSPSIAASDPKTRTSSGSLRAPAPPPRSSSIRAPSPVVTFGQHSNATAGHSRKQGSGKTMGYSPPRDVPDLTFSSASSDYAYKASVGADRWESLMKQQQIKNKAKENGNRHSGERLKDKKKALYGEVAYGGAAGSRADGGEEEGDGRLNGGLGLGMGHISVTRTVVNVSSEGK